MKDQELKLIEKISHRKNFYRSSEIASILDVKEHDISKWESEFPQIKPIKSRSGKKRYKKDDLLLFSAIRHLILEQNYSIKTAKEIISDSNGLILDNSCDESIEVMCHNHNLEPEDICIAASKSHSNFEVEKPRENKEVSEISNLNQAISPNSILHEGSQLIEPEIDLDLESDDMVHEIYQSNQELYKKKPTTSLKVNSFEQNQQANAIKNLSHSKIPVEDKLIQDLCLRFERQRETLKLLIASTASFDNEVHFFDSIDS